MTIDKAIPQLQFVRMEKILEVIEDGKKTSN